MYASVGDEVENAEQIVLGKSLKVQVSWSALLSSVGVGEKLENFTTSPEFVLHSFSECSFPVIIALLSQSKNDYMPSML